MLNKKRHCATILTIVAAIFWGFSALVGGCYRGVEYEYRATSIDYNNKSVELSSHTEAFFVPTTTIRSIPGLIRYVDSRGPYELRIIGRLPLKSKIQYWRIDKAVAVFPDGKRETLLDKSPLLLTCTKRQTACRATPGGLVRQVYRLVAIHDFKTKLMLSERNGEMVTITIEGAFIVDENEKHPFEANIEFKCKYSSRWGLYAVERAFSK